MPLRVFVHDVNEVKQIGQADIVNDGTGNTEVASYDVTLAVGKGAKYKPGKVYKVRVEQFQRSRGYWSLIGEAIRKMEEAEAAGA